MDGALERLELEYRHEKFGMGNRVERFFRYLKERTVILHYKMSARNHIQGITNLKPLLNLLTIILSRCEDWEVSKNAYLN
ncbi:MAG: hypothetical protein NDF52_07640 [archaeon YNP-WB-062]|jgi:hypothetical protein|nr:hypothetical protein [Candidatus Culexarchaeum yellowstonense]